MSNRQYVGARYVPKIMGEWNKALSYEALSIVTYLGNSFTSKQPVPANTDISNSDYWVNSGNYNEQVANLKEEVDTFNTTLNSVTTSLNNEISTRTEENLSRFAGKKRNIIFFGDSYGAERTNTDGKKYPEVCANLIGASFQNLCRSGASASGKDNYGHYYDQFSSYVGDGSDVTDVVLCGGANDTRGESVDEIIYGSDGYENTGLLQFINKAKSMFPNARYWLGFIGNYTEKYESKDTVKKWDNAYLAFNTSAAFGFSFMPNMNGCLKCDYFMDDTKFHPNQIGVNILGWTLANTICFGNGIVNTSNVIFESIELNGIFQDTPYNNEIKYVYDNCGISYTGRAFLKTSSNITLTNDNDYLLGTLQNYGNHGSLDMGEACICSAKGLFTDTASGNVIANGLFYLGPGHGLFYRHWGDNIVNPKGLSFAFSAYSTYVDC